MGTLYRQVGVVCVVACLMGGCAGGNQNKRTLTLKDIEQHHQQALARRPVFQKTQNQLPEHFGMSFRLSAFNELMRRVLVRVIHERMGQGSTHFSVGPIKIPLTLKSKHIALKLETSSKCPTCFQVSGKLLGKYQFGKVLNEPNDYKSRFSLIAPLIVLPAKDGRFELALDLSQVVKYGGMIVESKVERVPTKYRKYLMASFDKMIVSRVSKHLKPISLASFHGFSFGVEGLTITPTSLAVDAQSKTVSTMFYTNISTKDSKLGMLKTLGEDDAMSVGANVEVLTQILRLSMAQSKITSTYNERGQADGAVHIVPVRSVLDANKQGHLKRVRLVFQAYRFDRVEDAFEATGEAIFEPVVQEDRTLKMRVVSVGWQNVVTITGRDKVLPTTPWMKAVFLKRANVWLTRALTAPELHIPATTMKMGIKHTAVDGLGIGAFFGLSFQ